MVSKKRVSYLITKGVWGGAQKYVYNLAVSLPKDKYEVTVICGEGKILKQRLEENGIKVYEIQTLKRDISIFKEIRSFISLYKIIKNIRPDVLHLNSPKAGGIGALIGRIQKIPRVVYTVHGFSWNEDRTPTQKALITVFTWFTILLCHKTITISSKEEVEGKKLWLVNPKKILLIRNGVEKINFLPKQEARNYLSEKIGKNIEDAFLIGTISELHKNKGLEYAIAGLSKIEGNFMFIVLGGGEMQKELEGMVDRYNLKDKVHLLGFVMDASKYLKAFDLFTLTSIKEGLPYTVIEAGLAEVPVLASLVGGIPDIVDNGKNGVLVTKGKPGEIARGVEYLMKNPVERKNFAALLMKKMEKEFSLESMLKKTEELYN